MKTTTFFRILFLALVCVPMLLSCEKDPQPDPEPAPDYREKWAGRYWFPPRAGRFWATIVEGTDSMMHFKTNELPALDLDVTVHKDGTFKKHSSHYGDSLYLHGMFFAADSVYVAYPQSGHFGVSIREIYAVKLADDIPDPQYRSNEKFVKN